jgi:hypothetical protein
VGTSGDAQIGIRASGLRILRQDGSAESVVPWNLRTKDNLDIAPGLYIYQVEAAGAAPFIGKFAVLK